MFAKKVTESKKWLENKLKNSSDVKNDSISTTNFKVSVMYISSICKSDTIYQYIINPAFKTDTLSDYETYLRSFPGCTEPKDNQEALDKMLTGSVVIFLKSKLFVFEAKNVQSGYVSDANVEISILGPQDALVEKLSTNINLIRHRYHSERLSIENKIIGKLSQTNVAIAYDQSIADDSVITDVKKKLSEIDVDILQSAGQLHQLLTNKKWSLFPTLLITERPDRIVKNISEGKVVIIFETSPFALIIPSVFFDFFSSMDDIYQLPGVGRFLSFLRYMGVFIATLLPGFYVAVASYNPEIFRVQLALSIAGSRATVPYPSYLEILFMLFMMEFLIEASIRLPKTVGSAATTVGGLILGQAATEAGLVSNIMIIIVAAVAIANFVIPINAMGFAIRVVKYPILLISTLFGLTGLAISFIGLVLYLANQRSFGTSYFRFFEIDKPPNKKNKESTTS
ncbi:spore germination protein [Aquibacillus sp. 3ASR75-11]|uniref:Spore germination protein n=1 Tax=Terrihalobacillus insolitus TaxID=2950438 RepID=A0A9X4AKB3_9BACI|nr:spore germination protein [Terrihalobacillus insolitus]MDC3412401.1 spore germination protein [Terrihalobacillus insolitus]MDC3422906.1 spore germination protein [Terrihalobacillus insolitus]